MTIQFNCTECNKTIETPDDSAGKQCRCPDCGQVMQIPDPEIPIGQPFGDSPKPSPYSPNPYATPGAPDTSMPAHPPMESNYRTSDRSGLVLTLGIISIVVSLMSCGCCLLFFPVGLGLGIPAWVMGKNDLKQIGQGLRSPSQKSALQAGMICGIVGFSLATLSLILQGGFMLLHIGNAGIQGFGL